MKLMVVKMDDLRAVFAQWGITGSDVDEAFAALPAWDLMTTKAVTITDYVRGLDDTKWVLDRLAPSEVAEALANHKGGI